MIYYVIPGEFHIWWILGELIGFCFCVCICLLNAHFSHVSNCFQFHLAEKFNYRFCDRFFIGSGDISFENSIIICNLVNEFLVVAVFMFACNALSFPFNSTVFFVFDFLSRSFSFFFSLFLSIIFCLFPPFSFIFQLFLSLSLFPSLFSLFSVALYPMFLSFPHRQSFVQTRTVISFISISIPINRMM